MGLNYVIGTEISVKETKNSVSWQSSVGSRQLSVVSFQLSVDSCQLSVCGRRSAVRGQQLCLRELFRLSPHAADRILLTVNSRLHTAN
jgi:hypothetical protein